MNKEELPLNLIKTWVESLFEGIDEFVEEDTKIKILEKCGKACSIYHNHIEKIKGMKSNGKDLEEIIDYMNQEKMWCGDWIQKGNIIYSICKQCECPLVISNIVKLSPTFCYCSRGFVKSVFEEILDSPVNVKLEKAIGRGDIVCHFIIEYNSL